MLSTVLAASIQKGETQLGDSPHSSATPIHPSSNFSMGFVIRFRKSNLPLISVFFINPSWKRNC